MADLKSLFAKKDSNAQPTTGGSGDSAATKNEQGTAPAAPETTQQPANPVTKKPVFGVKRNPESGPKPSDAAGSESDSGGEQPKPRLATFGKHTRPRDSGSDASGVDSLSVPTLDALDSSEDEGLAPRTSGSGVGYFSDETPATKPTRELPEGLTKEQLGFVETIDSIYEIIHDPDMLGGIIRNIMVELKSNPEYTKLMAPEDFRAMVRGMRDSMGLARVKKQEAKAKKSGGGRKSKALDDDIMAGLDEVLAARNLS